MSRIGIQPIKIIEGVSVEVSADELIVKGPLGENIVYIPQGINIHIDGDTITVDRTDETKLTRSLHGTVRSLIDSAIIGAKDGFQKTLKIHGVGYRVKTEGTGLSMSLGWNHPIIFPAPENITFEVPDETTIVVKGHNKQKVGEVAARIREYRKPEPYKGKGIRYEGEYVRQKSAKAVVK
ncbi:50S ribosomal protein L6 [Candidatus Nomurabacteria bacterium]|uniref:Large ribosomal subunit protein uL6 n=1 Tax=Candidatus Dojkabacteria bacterium TaxID=2099670 RepID=A0A955I119_9BACT|nr:50S ribosomal protein L6 [Candidatus Dojkabacteria bacterium]MCB9789407.1 50S ribosomal protein L6 [Candidatus Nomurabacteria bacterium]MCB9803729.1 50S ribosomal protein L6 [Candidatus Nomurabacteria bacterium]